MHHRTADDRVRLTEYVPTLWLQQGEICVVVGFRLAPAAAYEVEFHKAWTQWVRRVNSHEDGAARQ
jgi:hypothetical protein